MIEIAFKGIKLGLIAGWKATVAVFNLIFGLFRKKSN